MANESLPKSSQYFGHDDNGHEHYSRTITCNIINREIKLFGVKINVPAADSEEEDDENAKQRDESLRKCMSLGSLGASNDLESHAAGAGYGYGYVSDGLLHDKSFKAKTASAHRRRKGRAWSEEEHRCFLLGLEKLGKGDWKGISKNYVHSRSPAQVASHAQKYYQRMTAATGRRKRRSSVFDTPLLLSIQMDSNSQTSSTSPSASPSPKPQVLGTMTSPVKSSERPPLSPTATTYAVSELLRRPLMIGVRNLSQTSPPLPIYPMWSFSNQKYGTAVYNCFPSDYMAQSHRSRGAIFSMLPPPYPHL